MEPEYGTLPKDPDRLVEIFSQSAIPHLLSALVELITNCDDSYRRLGRAEASGDIHIEVWRQKGLLAKLAVTDNAEGMDAQAMWDAVTYGKAASRFKDGVKVRGLFGLGLKDVLLAFGHGHVQSIKGSNITSVELDYRGKDGKAGVSPPSAPLVEKVTPSAREAVGLREGNGTRVTAIVTRKGRKFPCPAYKTLKERVARYYALRDINANPQRTVRLTVYDAGSRQSLPISYVYPKGECVVRQKAVQIAGTKVKAVVSLYAVDVPLDSCRNNPFGEAGIIVRTEGTIVDQTFFAYEGEEASRYFWGEIEWPDIARRLREEDYSVLTPSRIGLDKRTEYFSALQKAVEPVIAPFIEEKKKQLQRPSQKVSREVERKNKAVLKELNSIYKDLLERTKDKGTTPPHTVEKLTIAPARANVQLGRQRQLGIYLPTLLAPDSYASIPIELSSDHHGVGLVSSKSYFSKHPKRSDMLLSKMTVIAREDGARASVKAKFADDEAHAYVRVAPPTTKRPGKPRGTTGKFRDIRPVTRVPPVPRSDYSSETGDILIVVNNPSVGPFLGSVLEGAMTPEGSMLLAELIGDVVRKVLVRDLIDDGRLFLDPDWDQEQVIEAYDTFVNDICNPDSEYYRRVMEVIQHNYVVRAGEVPRRRRTRKAN